MPDSVVQTHAVPQSAAQQDLIGQQQPVAMHQQQQQQQHNTTCATQRPTVQMPVVTTITNEALPADGTVTPKHEPTTPTKTTMPIQIKNEEESRRTQRIRYWTCAEELLLVELWRRYLPELSDAERNSTVYQKITHTMRQQGFVVKPQECKRKLAVLKSQYNGEVRRRKSAHIKEELGTRKAKPAWKLWPLIDCFMRDAPTTITTPPAAYPPPGIDLLHESSVVNEVVLRYAPPPPPAIVKLETSHAIAEAPARRSNLSGTQPYQKRAYTPRLSLSFIGGAAGGGGGGTSTGSGSAAHRRAAANGVIFQLLKYDITAEGLQKLREENRLLMLNRNESIQQMKRERDEFQMLEKTCSEWLASLRQQLEAC